jgi:hypothetical protein
VSPDAPPPPPPPPIINKEIEEQLDGAVKTVVPEVYLIVLGVGADADATGNMDDPIMKSPFQKYGS